MNKIMSRFERNDSNNERKVRSNTRSLVDVMSRLYSHDLIKPVGVHSVSDDLVNHDPLRVKIKQTLLIAWGSNVEGISERVSGFTNVRVLDRHVYGQGYIQVRVWQKTSEGYNALIVDVYPNRIEADKRHKNEIDVRRKSV